MKTISSSKFASIAAVAAALFTSGTIAHAGEVYRASLGFTARAPIAAPVVCRPVRELASCPIRPVVFAGGPVRYAAPVYARPVSRVGCGPIVREGWAGRSYGFWGRR